MYINYTQSFQIKSILINPSSCHRIQVNSTGVSQSFHCRCDVPTAIRV